MGHLGIGDSPFLVGMHAWPACTFPSKVELTKWLAGATRQERRGKSDEARASLMSYFVRTESHVKSETGLLRHQVSMVSGMDFWRAVASINSCLQPFTLTLGA